MRHGQPAALTRQELEGRRVPCRVAENRLYMQSICQILRRFAETYGVYNKVSSDPLCMRMFALISAPGEPAASGGTGQDAPGLRT